MDSDRHQYLPEQLANVIAAVRDPARLTQIGVYHIDELIGEGGMGQVYKATQLEPIRRTVAIKVIKLGMDTRQVIARFGAERQTLAMMDHPNVATVLDAGATDNGRPYFVMEYVHGESITAFADREKLTVQQRLELFTQACEAVQHAHQKAVIHRDIKPSNMLVTLKDGKPWLKVIDFGVAKAIDQRVTEQTLFTEAGQLIGTPEYMAPEQADGNGLDVDTRTDVYALGVVLYELLIGVLPFDPTTLRAAGYREIQRIIREVDPPRPSTRLSGLGETANETAQLRCTQLTVLHQELKRELEWIPLKAMRKERAERYSSVHELAEDIENYLANRPLRAGPESRTYRTRKFLRRNKTGVAASAAIVFLLVTGIIGTSWQAIRAKRAESHASQERDSATAMLDFLTDDVLAGATPENIPDAKVRQQIVDAMITPAARRIEAEFKERPLIEASLHETIRSVLVKIGRRDLALPHAERGLAIRQRELGNDHPDTLTSMNNYASVLEKLGRVTEAESVYREVLQRRERLLGNDHPKTMMSSNNYAHVLWTLTRYAEAEPYYRQTLERRRRVLGEEDPDTIMSLNNYASVLQSLGRMPEAEQLYRQALEKYRRTFGNGHPQTLMAISNYASVLADMDRDAEAVVLHAQTLADRRRVLGEDHPDTSFSLDQYGQALVRLGRSAEAEPILREALELRTRRLGENHPETILSLNNCAVALLSLGKPAEAEAMAHGALTKAMKHPSLGPKHTWTRSAAGTYANCLDALRRTTEADALRRQFSIPAPTTGAATQPASRASTP